LEVAKGPTTSGGRSMSMDDRHPFGDVESVRQLVRVSLLLRWLESTLGGVEIKKSLIDHQMSNIDTSSANSTPTRSPSAEHQEIEVEGAFVDLSKRKHVQCRLRPSKSSQPERPIFLIITDQVMSIAEVVVPHALSNTSKQRENQRSSAQNQVKNTSIVPVHLIDAIVDSTDNKTLHLTVFRHRPPKMFTRLGSTTSDSSRSSLSCWRMTVGFANPGACSWTKATIEKHRAELRREKLRIICTMLGVGQFFSESAL